MKPIRIPSRFWYALSRIDPSREECLKIAKDIITTVITQHKGPTIPDPVADHDNHPVTAIALDIEHQTYLDFRSTLAPGSVVRDVSRLMWAEFSRRYPDYDSSRLSGLIPNGDFVNLAFYYPEAAIVIEQAIHRSSNGLVYLQLDENGAVIRQDFFERVSKPHADKNWISEAVKCAYDDARKSLDQDPETSTLTERLRAVREHRHWVYEAMMYAKAALYHSEASVYTSGDTEGDIWYQIRSWRQGVAEIMERINLSHLPEDASRLTVVIDTPDIWAVNFYGSVPLKVSEEKTKSAMNQLNAIFRVKE